MQEVKREYMQKKKELQQLFTGEKTVLLCQNVPKNTSLDLINDEDNPVDGRHYGC
jgi:hypothetical protein